ncbi:MAG: NAD-dependent epimerase/dehydratase family protein [Desulfuromonadales bacterium]|nr:NAD-dependent epimerase/dehydratase family protein [Desulfuromonadales bacterium]
MASLKIGIIGCGAATKRYYAPALKKYRDQIQELFLVDLQVQQAQEIKAEVGYGTVVTDYEAILPSVDGVVIALPHALHHPVALDFLNAGVHVLCEKPLAEFGWQVVDMIDAAEKNKVQLCVNNTRRMFPSFGEVKRILKDGELGSLKSVEFSEGSVFGWAAATGFYVDPKYSSKGVLLDLGPHVVDLLCWWLDGKPDLYECMDDSFGGPESVVSISAAFNDVPVTVFLNRLCDIESNFKIIGDKGTLKGKPFDWDSLEMVSETGRTTQIKLDTPAKNYPQFVLPLFGNFLSVIRGETAPSVSGRDVLNSIEFIEECYAKRTHFPAKTGDDIQIDPRKKEGITLVTGASGFIGGRIVEMLHLAGDHQVRAGIRQWASAARLGRYPVDIVQMDLLDEEAIEKALEGVTEVIHCAKGPGVVNAEGTKNLLEASLKKGVRRFVHLSTAEVYGEVSGDVDESYPLQYTGNEYNRTKIDAEKVCWEYFEKGLPVTVVRPSIVYGPFCKNWTIHFANMFLKREWGIYESYGDGLCNLVYVDDLVRTILAILDNENAVGQAFNINGPDIITWNEYFERFNRAMGLPPLKQIGSSRAKLKSQMMIPVRKLGSVVKKHFMSPVKKVAETFPVADKMMRCVEHSLKTTPCPDELKMFNKNAVFVNDKSKAIIGEIAEVDIDSGLYQTKMWLKNQKIF